MKQNFYLTLLFSGICILVSCKKPPKTYPLLYGSWNYEMDMIPVQTNIPFTSKSFKGTMVFSQKGIGTLSDSAGKRNFTWRMNDYTSEIEWDLASIDRYDIITYDSAQHIWNTKLYLSSAIGGYYDITIHLTR